MSLSSAIRLTYDKATEPDIVREPWSGRSTPLSPKASTSGVALRSITSNACDLSILYHGETTLAPRYLVIGMPIVP